MQFNGLARRLTDADLPRIGAMIGVGEDEIHAILDVESSGSGFDSKGRPKMLFEPHVFYRNLPHGHVKQVRAVREGLAYPKWKPGAYPKDSYPRLAEAIEIDETAALKACSWGLGQILGENYKAAGYDTVQEMVRDCLDSEAAHLEMMVRFIKAKRLDEALRRHDWAAFAKGYNGASYATHNYHTRLAKAYAKWAKRKDTDIPPPPDIEPPPPPDIEPAPEPEKKGPIRRVLEWLFGGGLATAGFLTDWKVATVVVLGIVGVALLSLIVALMLFGRQRVADWLKRKLRRA